MAISAQRFTVLDRETNISTAKFKADMDSMILNDPANALKDANAQLQSLLDSANQKALEGKEALEDAFSQASRVVKDAASRVTDLASLPNEILGDFLSSITGGNLGLQKSLKSMLNKCSNKGLGYGTPGKPFDLSMNCGAGDISLGQSGGKAGCDAGSFNDLLNKLTGGGYNASFKDLNSLLKSLMALSGYGYNLGMCGVFNALSQGMPKDILSRASGGLLSLLGSSGNTNGFLDVAKSSVGLTPLLTNPDSIRGFFDNFKKPSNVKESSLANLADRALGGVELLDDRWNKSNIDGSLTIAQSSRNQKDLSDAFSAKLSNRSFSGGGLNVAPSNDEDFILGAYLMRA